MYQLTTSLLVVCLSLTVLSASVGDEQSREARQLFYAAYPNDFYYGPEYDAFYQQKLAQQSVSPRLFFNVFSGIPNLLQNTVKPFVCPTCKVCPVCPSPLPGPATIIASAAGCTGLANIGACSRASLAPSGTATFTWPAVASVASLTIVAEAPFSIVSVKCTPLTGGITGNTQTASLVDNTFRDEAGFAQIILAGNQAAATTVICSWQSR